MYYRFIIKFELNIMTGYITNFVERIIQTWWSDIRPAMSGFILER